MGRDALRPDAPRRHRRAAEGKGGRRPGPQPRAATRSRPLGGEHGEHGEDPPLARSEHRGTPWLPVAC